MDFLNNAIFSSVDKSFMGAVLTTFDPDIYCSRAKVHLFTLEDFKTRYYELRPRGFKFGDDGMFYSDTKSRRVMTYDFFGYMKSAYNIDGSHVPDMTDLVLHGVHDFGFVLPDYAELKEECHVIPFRSFKVSVSSFNIYASYKTDEGFKTCSLLNLEDGSATEVYIAVHPTFDMSIYSGDVSEAGKISIGETEYTVYRVVIGLTGFHVSVGEAFLNYLAYNVAYYNIGEKLLKELQASVTPEEERVAEQSVSPYKSGRKPKVNVSIEHIYKESRLSGIFGYSNDPDALRKYMDQFPDAAISYQWLEQAYGSKWYKEAEANGKSNTEALATSCANLRRECNTARLKFAIELLTHRYYINMLGIASDGLGPILAGGGVNGESIKRVTF